MSEDRATAIDMAGGRFEVVLVAENECGTSAIFRTRMACGRRVPLHSHSDPEYLYVLSGSIDVFRQGAEPAWTTLEDGEGVMITDGVPHALRNVKEAPVDLIVVTNERLASFFREAGRLTRRGDPISPPGPEDLRRMQQVSEAFGYKVHDPQESLEITG